MSTSLPKLIVIAGPTGSGKTALSLALAHRFNGAIISSDSRQIYKEMNIGTAKPAGEWRWKNFRRIYIIDDVVHYNLDCLSPKLIFSVAEFKIKAQKWIASIHKQKQIPFLVGGTGLYIEAVIDNLVFPKVTSDKLLREELSKKTLEELVAQLKEVDPEAVTMIDCKNSRRVMRALEVSILSGIPFSIQRTKGEPRYDVLYLGVSVEKEELFQRLDHRIDAMMSAGLLDEVKNLAKKYPFSLPSMSGIGYQEFAEFLQGQETLEQAVEQLKLNTRQYVKRQLTWFKRDKRIKWCVTVEEMETLVAEFLEM